MAGSFEKMWPHWIILSDILVLPADLTTVWFLILTTNILELVRFLGFDQINFHNLNCRIQNYFQNILPNNLEWYCSLSRMILYCLKPLLCGNSTKMGFQTIDQRSLSYWPVTWASMLLTEKVIDQASICNPAWSSERAKSSEFLIKHSARVSKN